ncbi:reverse transcriptase domain-containing protein [Tanacetum coccineum]
METRRFLIPCEFTGITTCNALADLGASINLMPYSVWKDLALPELTPTCMTLELADRSITEPIGIAKDVRLMVGKFQFPADFVVGPMIFKREKIRECNPLTPYSEPIVLTASQISLLSGTLNFLFMEEAASEPLPPLPNHEQYMPGVRKELKLCEAKTVESSVDEPPEVELKELPPHLEVAILEGSQSHKRAIAWKLSDIKGVSLEFCTHKILMEEDYEPSVQSQRRVNPKIHDVIKKEVEKLLDAGLIYPISDSPWVSPENLIEAPGKNTSHSNSWTKCSKTSRNEYYCLPRWHLRVLLHIPIDPKDQEKTTFTCPYRTFAYRRMPFGLCNAPGTFQRCMMAIFHDMIEKTMEVFMDDFSVFGDSFSTCLAHLEKMLKRCEGPPIKL